MATKTFKIGLSNTDKQNMAQDVYERLLALTFPEYDTTTSYEVGDFVVYNDQLYKCIGATSGAWDSTKWQLATLNDLLTDIEDAVQFVNDKANVDGNYPTMTVGVADQLSPYDEESGDDQDEPFGFQATGTGNGTQPDFSTGSIALMKEKQGNTVVVNNQFANGDFASTANWNVYQGAFTVSSNIGTFTAQSSVASLQKSFPCIVGHSYLFICSVKLSGIPNATPFVRFQSNGVNTDKDIDKTTTNWQTIFVLATASGTGTSGAIIVRDNSTSDWVDIQLKNFIVIDLTQWFNGDIPQDLLGNPSNFYRYYQGSLAYNTGELVNADGRYVKCIGMNQWDEEWESGYIDGNGVLQSGTYIRSKNYISIVPNKPIYVYCGHSSDGGVAYYDASKNFIMRVYTGVNSIFNPPTNAVYCKFFVFGTTYNNDISINLYYEDEARCLTYEPYEVLTNNDTGTEVLRSAGNVRDYKEPNGTIHRKVGRVDLGDLNWTYNNTSGHEGMTSTTAPANIKTPANSGIVSNLTCAKYMKASDDQRYTHAFDNAIAVYYGDGRLEIYSSTMGTDATAFKQSLTGVYLFYELATPTTEQGTTFSENVTIDDFGSMSFEGTNGVPQGNLIFYPVDYKAFIDTLYDYTEGTPSNIALKSDLAVVNEKIGAKIPECPTTTDGTYVLKATVSDGEVVYTWESEA